MRLLFFYLLLPLTYALISYWIDPVSCDPQINSAITVSPRPLIRTVTKQAARAGKLLQEKNAPMQFLYNAIFHKEITDISTLNVVLGILFRVSSLAETQNRQIAAVRIYCDEDSRWTLQPDDPNLPPGELPNSKLPVDEQTWEDKANHITTVGTPGCREADTWAQTYLDLDDLQNTDGQITPRAAMTICKNSLGSRQGEYAGLYSVSDVVVKDLSQLKDASMAYLDITTTTTIFHEFIHVNFIGHTRDSHPVGGGSDDSISGYRWNLKEGGTAASGIQSLSAPQSLFNADSYAYLGAMTELLDHQWRLSSDTVAGAKDGLLERDTSLPRNHQISKRLARDFSA